MISGKLTVEQRILYDHVLSLWPGILDTSVPLYYTGAIAASEFIVYDVTKLYVALELEITGTVVTATVGTVTFYNELNVAGRVVTNESLAWDVTAAAFKMQTNPIFFKNQYFGRITVSQYTGIKFLGYRLRRV
jgi:hypothetical protein